MRHLSEMLLTEPFAMDGNAAVRIQRTQEMHIFREKKTEIEIHARM